MKYQPREVHLAFRINNYKEAEKFMLYLELLYARKQFPPKKIGVFPLRRKK